MTRGKAIHLKCLECSGNVAKDVTLCTLLDCPLWQFRCGCSMDTARYRSRIKNAFEKYPKDIVAIKDMGIKTDVFLGMKSQ